MDEPDRYEGGCHCGAVRFRLTLDRPDAVVALDCNCSICTMKGFLHLIVSRDRFALLAGADQLSVYRFNTRVAQHTFCRVCGIHPFYTPRSHPDGVDVNVRCLDDPELRQRLRIEPFDGRQWEASIATIR